MRGLGIFRNLKATGVLHAINASKKGGKWHIPPEIPAIYYEIARLTGR